ncbi:ABC transporter ATP-binding protein [Gemmatimonadota bacterium]
MSSPPVIEARDLTRHYGATVGLEALNLTVDPAEVFGFLGPNGSGKTTTIRLLLDLIRPTRGKAFLFGVPTGSPAIHARIGYLPGELALDGRMTGHQTLRFLHSLRVGPEDGRTLRHREELCHRLGLGEEDLKRRAREYSRGMKQKLGLVAAFQHSPDLLILDEPTSGLDPLVREVIFQLMAEARDRGATVFHSSHVLSEVDRTCSRVGILRDGQLVSLLSVQDVRATSVRRMVAHFSGDPPLAELGLPGVTVEEVDGERVILQVSGLIRELLYVLAKHGVHHLSFPEAGLEDAFRTFYRKDTEGQLSPAPNGGGAPDEGSDDDDGDEVQR